MNIITVAFENVCDLPYISQTLATIFENQPQLILVTNLTNIVIDPVIRDFTKAGYKFERIAESFRRNVFEVLFYEKSLSPEKANFVEFQKTFQNRGYSMLTLRLTDNTPISIIYSELERDGSGKGLRKLQLEQLFKFAKNIDNTIIIVNTHLQSFQNREIIVPNYLLDCWVERGDKSCINSVGNREIRVYCKDIFRTESYSKISDIFIENVLVKLSINNEVTEI